MSRFFCVFTLTLLFAISTSIFAQTVEPTPPEDDGDVVKITTNLIQIDAVITDKKGNQITDLKPEEIEIYENGRKQEITNLSYISAGSNKSSANNSNSKDKLAIPIPTKELRPEQVRRTYALVIDDLGLSFGSVFWVKKALEKFINEQMQEGDLVAIVRTGGGFGSFQPFTSDKNQLLASIKKLKFNLQGRIGVDSFEPLRTTLGEDLAGRVKIDGDGNRTARSSTGTKEEKAFLEEMDAARRENFSVGSLGSLNFLIRGMRELPGRKSVMFFSEGFALFSKSVRTPFLTSNRVLDAMKLLADTANRSSVVIYALDPRGIENTAIFYASDQISPSVSANNPAEERQRQLRESHQSLRYLADETGGFAFYNQNDLNKGMSEAIDDQSYYLIGYEPDAETFDPSKNRYNKFEVKVKRPGAKVRYRSGFFAVADNRVVDQPKTPLGKMRDALTSPFGANEIDLRLYTISGNDPKDGDFLRSLVNISAKDLEFKTEPNGYKMANFDIIAVTSGIDGKSIDEVMKNFTIRVDEKTYQLISERGFVYDLPIDLKKAGAYQFRIALRDTTSGKVGSATKFVEVPKFKKNRLWISDLVLESTPINATTKVSSGQNSVSTAFTDTTLREFNSPVALRFGAVIYNATMNGNTTPKLSMQSRLITNGKVIFEGSKQPIPTKNQSDMRRLDLSGMITIGNDLAPGDYIFQIIVTDELAKENRQISTQSVDFEIVD